MIDVGGRQLYLECVGSGSPTVVLEAGLGGTSDVWTSVLQDLGRRTRTCAYDRAGLGASDAVAGVHDARTEISDLEKLLDRAGLEPPYVLVGHSYGGLLARLFASAHTDQVAGVVFVDAMGRDATRRQLAIWPKSQAPAQRREWAKPVQGDVDLRQSEAVARGIRTFGHMPVIVITAARTWKDADQLPLRLRQEQDRLWGTSQDELAHLSSEHLHVRALRSGHFIMKPDQQPWIITRAVTAIVTAHRDGGRLPECAQLFTGPDVRCLR